MDDNIRTIAFDFNLSEVVYNLVHLMFAYVLALPVGWNRERETKSAGLRTFPLVSLASCGYMLVGNSVLMDDDANARVFYGIITGIGFIGGGAILKQGGTVQGTATAASIWTTGAIGVAVAWDTYEIAILLSVVTYLTLQLSKFTNSHET